jgi:uncharacterized protein YjbI with pentapeptide repeats
VEHTRHRGLSTWYYRKSVPYSVYYQLAKLWGADLSNANLSGADLTIADLSGAELSSAQNLTQRQLDKACGNEKTKLPEAEPRLTLKPCTN